MQLIFFIFLGVILVFGSAFVLLRTAKRPKVPRQKSEPESDRNPHDADESGPG